MDFDPGSPIWLQLVNEFTRRIAVGEWQPGARIPGVRDLAADVGVNPNTAQRALAELERHGLCRTERTAGRFITDDLDRITEARSELARDSADAFIRRAHDLQISLDRANRLITERWDLT